MAADGEGERIEALRKGVMPTEGISWVEMTAAVWMAMAAMAFRMREALVGGLFHCLQPLAAQLHNNASLSVWLEAKLAVAIQLQLRCRLTMLVQ